MLSGVFASIMAYGLPSLLTSRPVLLDGAIGTMLAPGLQPIDSSLANLHRNYLISGADIITTHTFSLQHLSNPDITFEANLAAADIARTSADAFSSATHPRFVAGSVGPTAISLSADSDATNALTHAYFRQICGLIRGGADIILIETITDPLNARAAIQAFYAAANAEERAPYLMLSFAICHSGCILAGGHTLQNALDIIDPPQDVLSVGVNCSSSPEYEFEALQYLSTLPVKYRSLCPNAGYPAPDGTYPLTPDQFSAAMQDAAHTGLAHILGGCCGTTPAHIKALHDQIFYKNICNCFI